MKQNKKEIIKSLVSYNNSLDEAKGILRRIEVNLISGIIFMCPESRKKETFEIDHFGGGMENTLRILLKGRIEKYKAEISELESKLLTRDSVMEIV